MENIQLKNGKYSNGFNALSGKMPTQNSIKYYFQGLVSIGQDMHGP